MAREDQIRTLVAQGYSPEDAAALVDAQQPQSPQQQPGQTQAPQQGQPKTITGQARNLDDEKKEHPRNAAIRAISGMAIDPDARSPINTWISQQFAGLTDYNQQLEKAAFLIDSGLLQDKVQSENQRVLDTRFEKAFSAYVAGLRPASGVDDALYKDIRAWMLEDKDDIKDDWLKWHNDGVAALERTEGIPEFIDPSVFAELSVANFFNNQGGRVALERFDAKERTGITARLARVSGQQSGAVVLQVAQARRDAREKAMKDIANIQTRLRTLYDNLGFSPEERNQFAESLQALEDDADSIATDWADVGILSGQSVSQFVAGRVNPVIQANFPGAVIDPLNATVSVANVHQGIKDAQKAAATAAICSCRAVSTIGLPLSS